MSGISSSLSSLVSLSSLALLASALPGGGKPLPYLSRASAAITSLAFSLIM